MERRTYGSGATDFPIPNLTALQTEKFNNFLLVDVPWDERREDKYADEGLQGILNDAFPIESHDKTMSLEYLGYELGRPRYDVDECRRLRLTYGRTFKVRLRLNKAEPVEEDVYLGEIPIMLGGGEFIINGAERVIVSQLHRSPGIDFSVEQKGGERRLHSCWIIPERGSWIEMKVSKKDILQVRIDQSGKFSAVTLLRAMSEEFSTDADIIRLFHDTEVISLKGKGAARKAKGKRLVGDLIDKESGDVLAKTGEEINDRIWQLLKDSPLEKVEVLDDVNDFLILNSIADDKTRNHEEALLNIYTRLRPGNPPQPEKARTLFEEKFRDSNRYRLGRVGRFRLNRKFELDTDPEEMTLLPEDFLEAVRYIMTLRDGEGEVDDIDHLGNRRIRTIDELAGDEFRKGLMKLKRTVQEKMNIEDQEKVTPRAIINSKTISSSIDYFFGRGELSQVVDQTNPLSQLTHERRLSALGPGGLNRKRAGFEVRDVHISHYGRICPIETPEGTNIGLIASLAIYATVDDYGFLTTPYCEVKNGKVNRKKVLHLRADQEIDRIIAPADAEMESDGTLIGDTVLARINGDFKRVDPKEVEYRDVSPKQVVGVSASLIPFLEHDDANRALMGSNMQRQAVPLVRTEPPVVATGMEREVAANSGMVVRAIKGGKVTRADADAIVISDRDTYELRKFVKLNERTCLNQKPIVRAGDKVEDGQIIADGAATHEGELALGRNTLIAFMPFDGYNFEDAILVSERLVKDDLFTSIHIEEFDCEIRETKLGREEFTRDIPNVSERALRNLDETGVVRIGTRVSSGDILVGKVSPKSKTELTPEEKLLHAIFGRAGEDVKNDSLDMPSGMEGVVIDARRYSRRVHVTEEERKRNREEIKQVEAEYNDELAELFEQLIKDLKKTLDREPRERFTDAKFKVVKDASTQDLKNLKNRLRLTNVKFENKKEERKAGKIFREVYDRINELEDERERRVNQLTRGDELPTGVLEMVKVYVATMRRLSVGDKMAGRHGNKGVIAKIMPEEDMPYLSDGTPVEMVLNPLGVPSRMNVGQILETHMGWAAKTLGIQAVTPVFDGAGEEDIEEALEEAGLPRSGKAVLFDGRTGEPFSEEVTVGYMYMLKLHHLVDDKVHARATGPYSLITQQPLGGKARFGGQRFGEMEVWALEAYGSAYILQELLTVKSDDVDGRTKIYEAMVKGENTLEPGTPVSFDVLTNEIKGLALNMELEKKTV